ncbi:4Fe-4S double cluster binding domain-containing protein [Candidatus Omnitrophota bacterium]
MEKLQAGILSKLTEDGASLVGFADIRELPANIRHTMRSAISIAAALDTDIVSEIIEGPTKRYHEEYVRINGFLTGLCERTVEYLGHHGVEAVAIAPTIKKVDYKSLQTPLPHKTVATRAGLGWIGKSALLITKQYGPAVRLASVLCDIEFETADPINESHCGECTECVDRCPATAIKGNNWEAGSEREMIYNARQCYTMAKKLSGVIGVTSTICGICIAACPYTQRYLKR